MVAQAIPMGECSLRAKTIFLVFSIGGYMTETEGSVGGILSSERRTEGPAEI